MLRLLAQQSLPRGRDLTQGQHSYRQIILPAMHIESTRSSRLRHEAMPTSLLHPDADPAERDMRQQRIDAVLQEDP